MNLYNEGVNLEGILTSDLPIEAKVNVLFDVLKNVLDEGAIRARTVRFKLQKYVNSTEINERIYALNVIASDGYARNYLFPRKLAEEATANALHVVNAKKENERKKKLAELEAAQKLAAELKGKEVTINAKAGDNGRLFGAITNKDIAEVINNKFNLSIDKKKIVVNTIKVAGEYEVEVKLYPEVSTKMKVIIVPKQ